MASPSAPVNLANLIGRPAGLFCRYEYDRAKQKFMYRFYRRGHYIGATGDPAQVVAKMERYVTAK